jgi:RNA polymerase sigma factor (sigma-70 family)
MHTPDEFAELLSRARAGDAAAMNNLLALAQPWLEHAAAEFHDPGHADASTADLVQEAWLQAWRKLDQFHGGDDKVTTHAAFRAWLGRIVRRLALNRIRERRAERRQAPGSVRPLELEPGDSGPSPSSLVNRAEQADNLRAAIERLENAEDRQLLALRFDEGLSFREIGARLGITHERVRRRLNTLLRSLEGMLE